MNYKKAVALIALVPVVGTLGSAHAAEMMTTTSANVMTMTQMHTSAANFLAKQNIIVDHSSNIDMYEYTSNITRREMVKVAMNISGKDVPESCSGSFSDLNASDWGCKYAEAALANGYISANTMFRPDDLITNSESLKMIMQAKGITRDDNSDWRAGYSSKAMSQGLISATYDFDTQAKRGWIFDIAALTYSDFSFDTNVEVGVSVGGALMIPSRDIVDNAVLSTDHTTLVAAVGAAGLVDTLKSEGPFTVFAPTNDAFAKLPAGTVETLLKTENKGQLTDILTYHVVAGAYTSADITDGLTLTTVEGGTLTFTQSADGKWLINGTAEVTIADVISSNGVTHVINNVLIPAE